MAQIIQKLKVQIDNSQLSSWSNVCRIIWSSQSFHRGLRKGGCSIGAATAVHNWTYSIISVALTTSITIFYSVISNAAPSVNGHKICNHGTKTNNRLCSLSNLQVARTQVRRSDTLTNTLFSNSYGKNDTFNRYGNIADFAEEADLLHALSFYNFQQSDFVPCKNSKIIHVNICTSLPGKIYQVNTQFLSQSNSGQSNISENTQSENTQSENTQSENTQSENIQSENTQSENTQQQDPPPVEGQTNLPTNSPTEATPLTQPFTQPVSQRELGDLRVRKVEVDPPPLEKPTPPPKKKPVNKKRQPAPKGYLIGNLGYFFSNNVFSSEVDPVDDSLFYTGLTLASAPLRLGKKTSVSGAVNGYLIRYLNQSDFDYNQIRFNVNLYHRLASKMYAGVGWTHQNLFYARNARSFAAGDRFLSENSLRLSLSRRDSIAPKLTLNSLYEFRYSFASPDSRNRVINSLWLSLNYRWQKPLKVGLNYQFTLSDFTMRDRNDNYHRLYSNLNYTISKSSRISLQSGLALGGSTDDRINFDSWFFSLNYNLRLGKF